MFKLLSLLFIPLTTSLAVTSFKVQAKEQDNSNKVSTGVNRYTAPTPDSYVYSWSTL